MPLPPRKGGGCQKGVLPQNWVIVPADQCVTLLYTRLRQSDGASSVEIEINGIVATAELNSVWQMVNDFSATNRIGIADLGVKQNFTRVVCGDVKYTVANFEQTDAVGGVVGIEIPTDESGFEGMRQGGWEWNGRWRI